MELTEQDLKKLSYLLCESEGMESIAFNVTAEFSVNKLQDVLEYFVTKTYKIEKLVETLPTKTDNDKYVVDKLTNILFDQKTKTLTPDNVNTREQYIDYILTIHGIKREEL